tara:strand:- start:16179 stop:16730 length:552 start_codon:yes stop_codon:yes gene_type:complete
MKVIIIIFTFIISLSSYAEKGAVTGLDLPRFVSLKSNDVNLRVGPSINYPIELKYIQINMPIEIIDEFDNWRKIRDHQDNIGWLHKSLIKGNRFVLAGNSEIKNKIKVLNRPEGNIVGIIEKNNILELKICLQKWCKISINNLSGWLKKNEIWGVYESEIYNESFFQPLIDKYWKILDDNLSN